jgi:hypothetical protein
MYLSMTNYISWRQLSSPHFMKRFNEWLLTEHGDIFGFDRPRKKDIFGFDRPKHALARGTPGPNQGDMPIDSVDSQIIMAELARHPIGNKMPEWVDTEGVIWGGKEAGAMQVELSPWGSYKVTIRRKINDLEGTARWICKRVFPVVEFDNDKNEEDMAMQLLDELEKLNEEMVEMPKNDYKDLEKLVLSLGSKVRRFSPEIFVFEGIKQISKNNYLIYLSLRGHGVEAPDSQRITQFNIDISYDEHTGLIRCFGNDVATKTKGHAWRLQPSEWDEVFCSTQSREEIENAILASLKTY